MKIFIFIFLFFSVGVNAQWYYKGYFCPEADLLINLQKAKGPEAEIQASGDLLMHYKCKGKDSLAAAYLNKIYTIAATTQQKDLYASALWWDALPRSKVTLYDETKRALAKADELVRYAKEKLLPDKEIAGNLIFAGINLYKNLKLAEKYALTAKQLLEGWKTDSSRKDSLKLEVYQVLARVFVFKRDGVNIAHYLLAQQDYAEQNRNEGLKRQATHNLADIYEEWPGQVRKAIFWNKKLYSYYNGFKEPDKRLFVALRMTALSLGNKDTARLYLNRYERLWKQLGVANLFLLGETLARLNFGFISIRQAVQLLDSHFNGLLFSPPALLYQTKAQAFMAVGELDSTTYYLAKAKENGVESLSNDFNQYRYLNMLVHLKKRQYEKAISLINKWKMNGEMEGDLIKVQESLSLLTKAYEGKGDFKKANTYMRLFYLLKDSLSNVNNNEEVALLQVQKERELQQAFFKEQQRIAQLEQNRISYRNKVRVFSLFAGIVLLLFIAALLWRNNRHRLKAYMLLEEQKAKTDLTLQELKATQTQLIHAEKMASLGELTAGIAHEIQNPLNFVNNFSEVSKELVSELKQEAESGNTGEVIVLADDVLRNLDKVVLHGKRADSIVKSMLQHARTGSGKKEPVQINKLAEEYLRFSYQGQRAKDKEFTSTIQMNFDSTIGEIQAAPRDIGRVLLNLFNNAFYAVNEKKKQLSSVYEPIVQVTTCKKSSRIEVTVKDNGIGMSPNIAEKVFQPFFTTKPTGEGTGLGLSLSYDIITKGHGGELKVKTKEGEGAEFIVQLPV